MKRNWILFMIALLVIACNNTITNEKEADVNVVKNEDRVQVVEEEKTDLEVEEPEIETAEEEPESELEAESLESILLTISDEQRKVYYDMLDFVKWYIENRDSMLRKRESIVRRGEIDDAFIDDELLNEYIKFLTEKGSDVLSKNFIISEDRYWKGIDEKLTKEMVIWVDGPNPWCFEADPIFYGHDWPDDFEKWKEGENDKYRELDPRDIKINGDTASLYFNPRRKLVKEEGKWKLYNWFYNDNY